MTARVRVHEGVPDRLGIALLSWLPDSEFAVAVRDVATWSVELSDGGSGTAAAALLARGTPTMSGAPLQVACAAPAVIDDAVDAGTVAALVDTVADTLGRAAHVEVVGPERLASPLAAGLAARLDGRDRVVMHERLMVATDVVDPTVVGTPRPATAGDEPTLVGWLRHFAVEAIGADAEAVDDWDVRVDAPDWNPWIWEVEGRPVAMVNHRRTTPVSSRIGPVYTPPEHRGNGYAGGLTAAVTRVLLEAGDDRVTLFTDEANATSNALYARVGFKDASAQGAWEVRRT